ncbi:guanylate cyclase domain-containing protein, partial [Nephila pilipes]
VLDAGGDVVMMEAGYLQCMWLSRVEDMEELSQKVLNVALYIQRRYGRTDTKFGRIIRNLIGLSCGEFECFFVGKKAIYYTLIGNTVKDSFHSASLCGNNEVVVSREFWKCIKYKEEYMFQTLPDEFVTVFSLRLESLSAGLNNSEILDVIQIVK